MAYRSRDELLSHVLDEEQVNELLALYKRGWELQRIAEHFNVHRNTVYNIIERDRRRKYEANRSE